MYRIQVKESTAFTVYWSTVLRLVASCGTDWEVGWVCEWWGLVRGTAHNLYSPVFTVPPVVGAAEQGGGRGGQSQGNVSFVWQSVQPKWQA